MQIKIEGDISDSDHIYIAPINGKINQIDFYGGLQTNTGGWKSKVPQNRTWVGRGGIFSRWAEDGTTPVDINYADGELGTLFESATYEGSFVSVRRKAGWGNGNFRYEIKKLNQQKITYVLSTPFGIMTDHEALKKKIGGELLFKIF